MTSPAPLTLQQATTLMGGLQTELDKRRKPIKRWTDYYDGEHDLAFASEKFQEAFGGLFSGFADNWCTVVCDSPAERLAPIGFRFGDGTDPRDPAKPAADVGVGDRDAMDIWQRNDLDAEAQILILETQIASRSFMLVWGDEDGEPVITGEDASQVVVAYEPGSRRKRKASLKQWVDDWGQELATLMTPGHLYKLKRRKGATIQVTSDAASSTSNVLWVPNSARNAGVLTASPWELRTGDEADDIIDNPLGKVSMVELLNRPRLLKRPTAEHDQIIPLQGGVNKLLADMMVGSEEAAMPARWATGLDVPRDPRTGAELKDEQMWKAAVSKLVRSRNKDAKFGNFAAADLTNFVVGIELLIQHIAAITHTPPHYMLAKLVNASGDALTVAEAGLVAKCRDKSDVLGNSFEEVMRLAFAVKDDDRSEVYTAETIWRDIEHRTEASRVDALLKKKDAGVPWRQRMEDAGYTPPQIERMIAMRREDAELDALGLGLDQKLDPADDGAEDLELDPVG